MDKRGLTAAVFVLIVVGVVLVVGLLGSYYTNNVLLASDTRVLYANGCELNRPGYVYCNGICKNLNNDNDNCGQCFWECQGGNCINGKCFCSFFSDNPDLCPNENGEICTNLQEDSNNCGFCGYVCDGGTCAESSCECPLGLTSCPNLIMNGEKCFDLQNNINNCGECGRICGTSGGFCQDGECVCSYDGNCWSGETCVEGVCEDDPDIS